MPTLTVAVKREPMVNLHNALNVRINEALKTIYAQHGVIFVAVETHTAKDFSKAWAELRFGAEALVTPEPVTTR